MRRLLMQKSALRRNTQPSRHHNRTHLSEVLTGQSPRTLYGSAKRVPVSYITTGDWQNDSLLNIENQSEQKTKFYVIREPPVFKTNKGPDKVYVAVYQTTDNVKETVGQAQSRLKGTTPDGLGPWIWMSQALLGPQSVELLVDCSFEDSAKRKYPFVGISFPHPWLKVEMTPVCVWEAEPGTAYALQPGNSWRCFFGELKEVLDQSSKNGSSFPLNIDKLSSPCRPEFKMNGRHVRAGELV
ncbi:hypothetical protein CC86DRAFT_407329 [Ophiobolus disseminans]|uniref:Uncharacterized protein n=1 Tax=Ophiobolus disseminans TaxID=1469910 RepID=A0A6A6ZVK5_9PLEO|nr:hypothetical protein CC86DRAFT_407329 [Ophiobolus disseminans]